LFNPTNWLYFTYFHSHEQIPLPNVPVAGFMQASLRPTLLEEKVLSALRIWNP